MALIGFYDALKGAGPTMILAPILVALGWTLVTVSHLVPLAMAYELAPAYAEATPAAQASLAVTADTLSSFSPRDELRRQCARLGRRRPALRLRDPEDGRCAAVDRLARLVRRVFAGWLSLLGPASSAIEGLTVLGFLGFFVFMASMGVALLRRRDDRRTSLRAFTSRGPYGVARGDARYIGRVNVAKRLGALDGSPGRALYRDGSARIELDEGCSRSRRLSGSTTRASTTSCAPGRCSTRWRRSRASPCCSSGSAATRSASSRASGSSPRRSARGSSRAGTRRAARLRTASAAGARSRSGS